MNQVLIYTEQTSNRLTYIFDLLIADLLGLSYELTHDKERFLAHSDAKFSYAAQPVSDEIFFESASLLFETNIDLQPISFVTFKNIKGFYPVSKQSTVPFDLFASAFFMVSRYEEYLPSKSDKYNRYRGSQSMNHLGEFLEKPMVNLYGVELRKILANVFSGLDFKEQKFRHLATFDVDMAFSYLEKGFRRNLGGFIRSFILSDYRSIKERMLVLLGRIPDPFDTFDYIFEITNRCSTRSKFFFLLGDGSQFDKNISFKRERFQNIIRRVSEKTEVGIHLSFKGHLSRALQLAEIKRLNEITGKNVVANRFHYLRFQLPDSYLELIEMGIKEDYSMGYAPRIGFRAGICTPFYFYDLKTDNTTGLKVVPLSFMDTTFPQYKYLKAEEALPVVRGIMKSVAEVGGVFVSLWHNSSFVEQGEWAGWRKVFETIMSEAAEIEKTNNAHAIAETQ